MIEAALFCDLSDFSHIGFCCGWMMLGGFCVANLVADSCDDDGWLVVGSELRIEV